jgi:hypothetical protein
MYGGGGGCIECWVVLNFTYKEPWILVHKRNKLEWFSSYSCVFLKKIDCGSLALIGQMIP